MSLSTEEQLAFRFAKIVSVMISIFKPKNLRQRLRSLNLKWRNVTNLKSRLWFTIAITHLILMRFIEFVWSQKAKTSVLDVAVIAVGRSDNQGSSAMLMANAYQKLNANAKVALMYELYKGDGKPVAFERCPSETAALNSLDLMVGRIPLPIKLKSSYFFKGLNGFFNKSFTMLMGYLLPINNWLLSTRPKLILCTVDAHYQPRYACLAATLMGIPSVRLQISGSNEFHKDDVPFYPLFADCMIVWGEIHKNLYEPKYKFNPDPVLLPLGAPRYDDVIQRASIRSCRNGINSEYQILVISNTQFYKKDSIQNGNPTYLNFANYVINLIQRQNVDGFRVIVKLHPRESLDDLYRELEGWKEEYTNCFVKDVELQELIQQSSGVMMMFSTVMFDSIIQEKPVIIMHLGTFQDIFNDTLLSNDCILRTSKAVSLAMSAFDADSWINSLLDDKLSVDKGVLESLMNNPGIASMTIARLTMSAIN